MNNLKKSKKHYNEKGWVVLKDFFSIDEINLVNQIIKDFLKKKSKRLIKIVEVLILLIIKKVLKI